MQQVGKKKKEINMYDDDILYENIYGRGGTVPGYMGDVAWVPHPYHVIEQNYDAMFYWRFIQTLFVMFFVSVLGFGSGVWLVANFLHVPWDEEGNGVDEADGQRKEVLFEEKYLDTWRECDGEDYETLIQNKERMEALKNCTIMEYTPKGTVAMFYHDKDESFWYYSDGKDVPVNYLDTLCRHYTTMFQCKNLYVHVDDVLDQKRKEKEEEEKRLKEEEEMKKEDGKKEVEGDGKNEEKKQKSVFASFKNYHQQSSSSEKTIGNEGSGKGVSSGKNGEFVVERGNRYTYKGKMSDYKILKQQLRYSSSMKKLDFSSFKKMMMKQNEDGNVASV